jgi:hypothetical protein
MKMGVQCIGLVLVACGAAEGSSPGAPSDGPAQAVTTANSGEVVVLASGQFRPWTISLDVDNVYWVSAGTVGGVYKVSKGGGPVTPLYEGEMPEVESLGIDATSVYFPSQGNILAVPISGGSPRIVAPSSLRSGLAVVAGVVYWLEPSVGPGQAATVNSISTAGGVATSRPLPAGFRTDVAAYYTVAASDAVYATVTFGGTGILRIPIDGGPITSVDVPGVTGGIAIDKELIFFGSPDTIAVAPISGGVPNHLVPVQASFGVTVDNSSVFFVDNGPEQRIARVAKTGGQVTLVASHQGSPHAVAVDAESVYWNSIDEGAIKKARK